jgi:hypothetical protein
VVYDEATPDSILAIDERNRRKWLVCEAETIPMAYMDQITGDRTRLNKMLDFKKEVQNKAIAANADDMSQIEAESLLKGFFTTNGGNKGIMAEAKRALAGNNKPQPEDEMDNAFVKKGSLKIIE